jgi:CP family cyanate transporter-like MFS transporter
MTNRKYMSGLLLWICGAGLRLSVLAVPPVISLIQSDLKLSGTEIGILTGIPVILFGLAAAPGSLLIERVGVRWTLASGLAITALGSGLRALAPEAYTLYAATVLMSGGIAIMQPAMGAAVRQWMPERAAFGTALYTNGLIVGEVVPVALMLPLLLPFFSQSWRLSLLTWSGPLLVMAIMVFVFAPRAHSHVVGSKPGRLWPDLASRLNWKIGVILASGSSTYFCTNAFLPAYLTSIGRGADVSVALMALNVGQFPISLLMVVLADWFQGKRWPFYFFGVLMLSSVLGIVFSTGWWLIMWAGVTGMACSALLTLGMALPPLLARNPDDVARILAAALAISYTYAMLISLLSGMAWDIGGMAVFAFLPVAIAAIPILFTIWTIPLESAPGNARS